MRYFYLFIRLNFLLNCSLWSSEMSSFTQFMFWVTLEFILSHLCVVSSIQWEQWKEKMPWQQIAAAGSNDSNRADVRVVEIHLLHRKTNNKFSKIAFLCTYFIVYFNLFFCKVTLNVATEEWFPVSSSEWAY